MPLDPNKLKTYLSSAEPRPARRSLPVAAPAKKQGKVPANVSAMREALIHGDMADDDMTARLLSEKVGYMELFGKASGFACGSCASYDATEGVCTNAEVRAPVSDDHGCCNLWWPADESDVTFPPMR